MKTVHLHYGDYQIEVAIPDDADVLSAGKVTPLSDPAVEISRSLKEPLGTAPLYKLARGRDNAAIVVSDNTRPVPYKGLNGILSPIIETLKQCGIDDIKIVVACGTHRPMGEAELRDMLGHSAFRKGVQVINHVATDESMLRSIGSTERVSNVTINRHYLDAKLKIATVLVEPHFMAGFSGGRKAICPGICGQNVTYGFHSASLLNEKSATSLVLESNPCHEEALQIAKMAGVDFIVNVTIDNNKHLTGVFSGDLEKAHLAAIEHLRTYAAISIDKLYDVVITQADRAGVNHYQCAKAAFEASRAVKPGGQIVLVGDLTDPDPVGRENYKAMLRLANRLGPAAFCQQILSKDWAFVPDQWEVQMWAKISIHLGDAKQVYLCAPQLENCPEDLIAEVNMVAENGRLPGECNVDFAQRVTQQTIDRVTSRFPHKEILLLPDGPYAVPMRGDPDTTSNKKLFRTEIQ